MPALLLIAAADVPLGQAVRESVDATECKPRKDQDEVIVCANRDYRSPYRLPERSGPFDPAGEMKSVMNERVGWAAEGDVGTQSCSTVGLGGWTGCILKMQKQNRDQYQWGKNVPTRRW